MPIRPSKAVTQLSEEDFKKIAHDVVGRAFDLHSEFGILFPENVYKHELADRCAKLGYRDVVTEFPIELTHKTFQKTLYVDLLIDGGALFELKAQLGIVDAHRAQTLNYLFLADLNRSKLINFGAGSLEHEFVSTWVDRAKRYEQDFADHDWSAIGPGCDAFRRLIRDLLDDWGGWLTLPLYIEALVHLLGGCETVVSQIEIDSNGSKPLLQKAHLLSERVAFKLTGLPGSLDGCGRHIQRWLDRTQLAGVQWVNLYQRDVRLYTLRRKIEEKAASWNCP